MKITKSQLREIIREEIQKIKQPKMSTRLKELINKGWVLSEDEETVVNPETGRTIKVKTALSYPPRHPAHKAVMQKRQDAEDAQADRQAKKDATQAVSAMRGKVSATAKNDKILSKFVNNSDAVDKLSPKSKEKLYKLVDTRLKLVSKINDRLDNSVDKLDDKYNDSDVSTIAQFTGRTDDDGNDTYEIGGRTFSGPSHWKYEKFFYNSPEAKRVEDISGRSNFSAAYKNAAWTLKNPKMGVMKPEEAQSIVDEFEKLNNDHSKIENLTKGTGGKLRNLRDTLANSLSDNRYDKNIRGTRFDYDSYD